MVKGENAYATSNQTEKIEVYTTMLIKKERLHL